MELPRKKEKTQPEKLFNWKNGVRLLSTAGFFIFLAFGAANYGNNYGDIIKNNFENRPSTPQLSLFKNLVSSLGISNAQPDEKNIPADHSSFDDLKLEAKAAYVFDILKNESLFESNADAQLPLASLTKIMTAIVAKENFPSYLDIIIPKEAILQEGDEGFLKEERWPVNILIDAMLISSSNDAAFALAYEFNRDFGEKGDFVSLMNQKAKNLNLDQTYFINPTGLDASKNSAGAYGSAKNIAKLFLYAFEKYPALIEITREAEMSFSSHNFKNTDRLVNELPGFIAGKTGYSDLAGGNLAVIIDKGYGHPIIIVVLGSTFNGRFNDVKTLYQTAISDKI